MAADALLLSMAGAQQLDSSTLLPMAPISSSLSLLSMVSSRVPSLFSSWRELPAPCSTANRGQ